MYNSALERLLPPAIKTVPLFSSVEVWSARAEFILPTETKPTDTVSAVEPLTDPSEA